MPKIKLKLIGLEDISKVTFASNSKDRPYGRRFTVKIGDDSSKDLVFKDLYRKAQKLLKEASSNEELNEVHKFIDRLIEVEDFAKDEYNNRDDFTYKFRTFFHRFFGGAFLGSHSSRLENLRDKVERKQERNLEEFKGLFQSRPDLFNSFVHKNFEVVVDGRIFDIRVEISDLDRLVLRIQKKEDVGTDTGLLVIRNDAQNKCQFEFEGLAGILPDDYRNKFLDPVVKEAHERLAEKQGFLNIINLLRYSVLHSNNNRLEFTIDGSKVVVSLGPKTINIQKEEHGGSLEGLLSIPTDSNGFAEFEFEGRKTPNIPESMIPIFNEVVRNVYQHTSGYKGVTIRVIREGIKLIPEWHLNQLCGWFNNDKYLKVEYLAVNLNPEDGSDVGGLKRDYISTLSSTLQGSETLFATLDGSLKIPRIVRAEADSILYCNEEEVQAYQNLGHLFIKCYESLSTSGIYDVTLITTGKFFSEAVFKAILALKADEIIDSGNPDANVYVKIARILLEHIDPKEPPTIGHLIECLDLNADSLVDQLAYLEINSDTLEQYLDLRNPILQKAVQLAGEEYKDNMGLPAIDLIRSDPTSFIKALQSKVILHSAVILAGDDYQDDFSRPDIASIKKDPVKFINDLRSEIFKDKNLTDELNGVSLGAIVDPTYHIAKGMKDHMSSWEDFITLNPVDVSNKIQGSLDRNKIVDSFEVHTYSSTINKKMAWLKEWIESDATDEELSTFLKFVTGSNSLPEGKNIFIKVQAEQKPYIEVSTCSLGISISNKMKYGNWNKDQWDNTKESFIRNLKGATGVEGFQTG